MSLHDGDALTLGIMEVGGALLLLWGGFGPDWATRVSGLLFTIVMVHAQYGWSSVNMGDNGGRGMEFQVLIIAVSLLGSGTTVCFRGSTAPDR